MRLAMRSVASVCPVRALITFESLNLETPFLVSKYIFRISSPCSYVNVIGSRSKLQEQNPGYANVIK